MLGLSILYALGRGIPAVEGALFGIKAAVLVIVVEALRAHRPARAEDALPDRRRGGRVHRHLLSSPCRFRSSCSPRAWPAPVTSRRRAPGGRQPVAAPGALARMRRCALRDRARALVACRSRAGRRCSSAASHVLGDIGLFFSKLAVVSFGGAYALLAYMAQQAVETYQLDERAGDGRRPRPRRDDARAADPGHAVRRLPRRLSRRRAASRRSPPASLGAALTTWVTFVPPIMLIFAGAPFVEQLRANAAPVGRARRDHRGGGRRDPQPHGLVRAARALRHGDRTARRAAALVRVRPAGARPQGRRARRPRRRCWRSCCIAAWSSWCS